MSIAKVYLPSNWLLSLSLLFQAEYIGRFAFLKEFPHLTIAIKKLSVYIHLSDLQSPWVYLHSNPIYLLLSPGLPSVIGSSLAFLLLRLVLRES